MACTFWHTAVILQHCFNPERRFAFCSHQKVKGRKKKSWIHACYKTCPRHVTHLFSHSAERNPSSTDLLSNLKCVFRRKQEIKAEPQMCLENGFRTKTIGWYAQSVWFGWSYRVIRGFVLLSHLTLRSCSLCRTWCINTTPSVMLKFSERTHDVVTVSACWLNFQIGLIIHMNSSTSKLQ